MSRDKKTPKSTEKKNQSDYQKSKSTSSKVEIVSIRNLNDAKKKKK